MKITNGKQSEAMQKCNFTRDTRGEWEALREELRYIPPYFYKKIEREQPSYM